METITSAPWSSGMVAVTAVLSTIAATLAISRNRYVAFYVRYYAIIISYVVFGIFFLPLLMLNPGSPKNAWWLIKFCEYFQLPLCRVNIKTQGCPYPDGPFVIVCNHQSTLDSPVMMHKDIWPGNCVVIMKKIMKYAGPFGLCLILSGTIFVERKSSTSAKDMLKNAVEAIHRNKYRVWVFPEGTRRLMVKKPPEEPMLPFKKGAFNLAILAQVPIVPLVLSPQDSFFNYHDCKMEPGDITATVLPPIPTTNLTLDDVPKLTEDVRSKMLDVFVSQQKIIQARNS